MSSGKFYVRQNRTVMVLGQLLYGGKIKVSDEVVSLNLLLLSV
ncbi:hypothetical protein [Schinkia azotoformans]|nr:hypothetical protein [Schinkia azotoformans]MEC1722832.1 hypothetical protein [Schinkia azotoformans]